MCLPTPWISLRKGLPVPLTKPPFRVDATPRGVREVRAWIAGLLRDLKRSDLVETAELGVSELITNALLHAEAPITVAMRGTRDHPRIEVADASPEPPVMPEAGSEAIDHLLLDDDDLLVTFGRGLDLVARSSDAWGADLEENGKVVWFCPAASSREVGVKGAITGLSVSPPSPDAASMQVCHLGVPIPLLAGFERHHRELHREVRLLALASEPDYPLAKSISDFFGTLSADVHPDLTEQLRSTNPAEDTVTDFQVSVTRRAVETIGMFANLLNLADDFCREQRLLSLARTPEQVTFQHWWFEEFRRQAAGRAPTPWQPRQGVEISRQA